LSELPDGSTSHGMLIKFDDFGLPIEGHWYYFSITLSFDVIKYTAVAVRGYQEKLLTFSSYVNDMTE
jgi:hypothetical protein